MINSTIYRLEWALCIILFFLIVLGAGVRLADAGLACPDWPLCFGQVIPPFNTQVFLEWFHRKVALWVGVLALGLAVWTWWQPSLRREFGWLRFVSLSLFLVQALLGWQTVAQLLDAHIVSAHLMGGYALYALHLFIATKMKRLRNPANFGVETSSCFKKFLVGFWIVLTFQVLLGGLVSSNYAGLACGTSFPLCLDRWMPPLKPTVAIHFFHRLGAFIVLGLGIWGAIWASRQGFSKMRNLMLAVLGLILLQIVWAVGMLHSQVHFGLSLAHSATSLLIFSLLALGSYHVCRR